jgi:hypothetical protein
MLRPGEVQRDLPALHRCRDSTGEHTGALIGRFARQAQHPHAGIVVV